MYFLERFDRNSLQSLCFCFSGAVHDSIPFLLPVALSWRLHASVQWQRPADAAMGQRVQVSIFLFLLDLHQNLGFDPRCKPSGSFCSKFDLYTKNSTLPDVDELKPYYQSLIDKYCPGVLQWWTSRNRSQLRRWWKCKRWFIDLFIATLKLDVALSAYFKISALNLTENCLYLFLWLVFLVIPVCGK